MSTTTLKFFSLPSTESGVIVNASATAWSFGPWKLLGKFLKEDIYVYSLNWQETRVTTADTTYQVLFEIGVGSVGREVTKLQVPYSYRSDTAVSYYSSNKGGIFLPEPYFIPQYSTVSIRVANSVAAADTYNGMKLQYLSASSVVPPSVSNGNIEIFKGVSAGSGISVSERSW